MESKYDKVKTAKELIDEIEMCGRSNALEDIVRMQDIFGHSTEEELAALANSSDYDTKNVFYSTLFAIWNWEDAVRFWNLHSNTERDALAKKAEDAIGRAEKWKLSFTDADKKLETAYRNAGTLNEEVARLEDEVATVSKENADLKFETMALKAKLYDLMTQAG